MSNGECITALPLLCLFVRVWGHGRDDFSSYHGLLHCNISERTPTHTAYMPFGR